MSAPAPPTLNVANALTVLRLLLVPVLAVLLLREGGGDPTARYAAFVVFVVAAVTDRIDGQLARNRNLVTRFGQLADPIADKALTGAALVGLSVVDELPWAVTAVVLARELGVTLLRFVVLRHGVIAASRGGKWKTVLQGVAIGAYLIPLPDLLGPVRVAAMAVAVAVTVLTGIDYVVRAVVLRRTSERTAARTTRRAAARAGDDRHDRYHGHDRAAEALHDRTAPEGAG